MSEPDRRRRRTTRDWLGTRPCRRVTENKRSSRARSMTHLQSQCSYYAVRPPLLSETGGLSVKVPECQTFRLTAAG
jgi:hypothetical protein